MGINDIGQQAPAPPTTSERQANTKRRLIEQGRRVLQQVTQGHDQIVKIVWEHPHLTPDEVVAGLGTDGAQLFAMISQLRTFVEVVQPGHIDFVVPREVTANQDGTLSLAPEAQAEDDGGEATDTPEAAAETSE